MLGVAIVAQQLAETAELQLVGLLITFGGLSAVGLFGARDAGVLDRGSSLRAGAVAGLIAGLVAALASIALLLFSTINGDFSLRVAEAMQQLYTPDQIAQLEGAGVTLPMLAQVTAAVQMMCCGVGLPVAGLFFGAMGGTLAPGARGRTDA